MRTHLVNGIQDICAALRKFKLFRMLGWQDMILRYRRSTLGPFWITLSMGIMIGTMGLVFGQIFQTAMSEYLPFLAIGNILWALLTNAIIEGCTSFSVSEGIIKQIDLPMSFHIFRTIWRNILIFFHNAIIIPLTFLVMWHDVTPLALLAVPGFLLFVVNISWLTVLAGVLCTRFRDLPQLVNSLLLVAFYVTPVMWMPSLLPKRASLFLLDLNPFSHLLEIVRAPLMGVPPSALNWLVASALAVCGWTLAAWLMGRCRHRIAYWL